jgi:hypothetical protein
VVSRRPEGIRNLKLTGEDGRQVKLTIQPWRARDSSDQRNLLITIRADDRTPLGFYIQEDDLTFGTDDALFWLGAWLTRAGIFCPACGEEQELPRPAP